MTNEELMKEWGFQNEGTAKIFAARQKKKLDMKKKPELTAQQKYDKFMNSKK